MQINKLIDRYIENEFSFYRDENYDYKTPFKYICNTNELERFYLNFGFDQNRKFYFTIRTPLAETIYKYNPISGKMTKGRIVQRYGYVDNMDEIQNKVRDRVIEISKMHKDIFYIIYILRDYLLTDYIVMDF